MKKKSLIIFGIILGIFINHMVDTLGFQQDLPETNSNNCRYIDNSEKLLGSQDIVQFNSTTLITGSNNHFGQELGRNVLMGTLSVIYNADTDQPVIEKLQMNGFPVNAAFYPHGLYINQQRLYVLTHKNLQNRDHVEVFDLGINTENHSRVFLNHSFTIIFPQDYLLGTLNDFIVTAKNELYITNLLPFSSQGKSGISKALIKSLELIFQIFRIKHTYAHFCVFDDTSSSSSSSKQTFASCHQLEETASVMANGIAWNEKNIIYLSQTMQRKLSVFEINQSNNGSQLKFLYDIPLSGMPDNVDFDSQTNSLTIGMIMRGWDHMNFVQKAQTEKGIHINIPFWGGVDKVDLKSNSPKGELLVSGQSIIQGCSVGLQVGSYVYLGTWVDKSIVACKIN